jgi:hypothetical protein
MQEVIIVSNKKDAPDHIIHIFENILVPGSVAVLKKQEGGGAWLYYEGGIYNRQSRNPTLIEKTDYAKIAAGRASANYPTIAKHFIREEDLKYLREIGRVNLENWDVRFDDADQEGKRV